MNWSRSMPFVSSPFCELGFRFSDCWLRIQCMYSQLTVADSVVRIGVRGLRVEGSGFNIFAHQQVSIDLF